MTTGRLPSFETYGNYSSSNYGANALRFNIGLVTVWFSYNTPVAFTAPGMGKVVRQNEWGPTTGKHLNWIDGGTKRERVNGDEFVRLLEQAIS